MELRSVAEVLTRQGIRLGLSAVDKWDAIRQCGALLIELGAVSPEYADTMLERERTVTTYIGEGVAIPHGTDASRALVRRTTLGVLQFPAGVDWDGQRVTLCVAIAAKGDEHVTVLSALATILMEPDQAARLRSSADVDVVYEMLAGIGEGIKA
jgi:mannitol/fructose-specific phosphotransferase system IIA component